MDKWMAYLSPYNIGITNSGDYHPLMTVDTLVPSITIISPLNVTYSNASITLNVATNQTANVTYSLNGDANISIYKDKITLYMFTDSIYSG